MRKVLLSIKPQFVAQIQQGNKRFEYRRKIFKDTSVNTMLIYSSSPVCKVIGECRIARIHSGLVNEIWEQTAMYSGITADYYYQYFEGLDRAFAIELSDVIVYDTPKDLADYQISRAPQSFQYIDL